MQLMDLVIFLVIFFKVYNMNLNKDLYLLIRESNPCVLQTEKQWVDYFFCPMFHLKGKVTPKNLALRLATHRIFSLSSAGFMKFVFKEAQNRTSTPPF